MVRKVFFDTNIILDLALKRTPFFDASRFVLAAAQNGMFEGYTSSLSIASVHYVFRKNAGEDGARSFLTKVLSYLTILPIDHAMTLEALTSSFHDFEDALQYGAAVRNRCECIITRNTVDFKTSKIDIYEPGDFLRVHFS